MESEQKHEAAKVCKFWNVFPDDFFSALASVETIAVEND